MLDHPYFHVRILSGFITMCIASRDEYPHIKSVSSLAVSINGPSPLGCDFWTEFETTKHVASCHWDAKQMNVHRAFLKIETYKHDVPCPKQSFGGIVDHHRSTSVSKKVDVSWTSNVSHVASVSLSDTRLMHLSGACRQAPFSGVPGKPSSWDPNMRMDQLF